MTETTTRGPMGRHVDIHRKAAWDAALEAYTTTRLVFELAAEETPEREAALADNTEALKLLIRTRAPDLDAMREKVHIMRTELGEHDYAIFTQMMADIDHLN
jgi:hypothetical protein